MAKRRRPKKRPRVIQKATALATVGAAGASAVLAARPPTPGLLGLATLLVGLFPLTFSLAMPQVAERRRLDIQRWWERATEPEDGQTQDAVWRYLEQNAGEPWVGETIAQATRSLLDALDESVVPVLGTLTRRYLRAERRPDRFFRDFSRFLADLSAEELAALRTVFDRAAPVIETLGPRQRE